MRSMVQNKNQNPGVSALFCFMAGVRLVQAQTAELEELKRRANDHKDRVSETEKIQTN